VLAAILLLVGCVLPWWTVGGRPGEIPALSGNGFEGAGILVFLAAVACLALVTLPYAAERPVGADRWPAYALLAVGGWLGLGLRGLDLLGSGAFAISEIGELATRMPGLWIAAVGLVILSRAAFEIASEPPRG